VIVAVVLLHCGYLWWQQRLAPDTDILALYRPNGATRRASGRWRKWSAAQQRVIVLIGAADWDGTRRAASVEKPSHLCHLLQPPIGSAIAPSPIGWRPLKSPANPADI
jgi:hypothetical protein